MCAPEVPLKSNVNAIQLTRCIKVLLDLKEVLRILQNKAHEQKKDFHALICSKKKFSEKSAYS